MINRLGIFSLAVMLGVGFAASMVSAATVSGKQVYETNCASCHQANGQGLGNAIPPLAKNSFVVGDAKAVVTTVLQGKTGAITVNGQSFNGVMPDWDDKLSNAEVAAVVSYIRSSWGNKASAVTESFVAALNKKK